MQLFGKSTKKGKGSRRSKGKRRSKEPKPEPPAEPALDPKAIEDFNNIEQTEKRLLQLHGQLIEFYKHYKPENLDEDVLTILMQFYIDSGEDKLNAKLKGKYGEDLNTFVPKHPANFMSPPPAPIQNETLNRAKRRSLEKELDITLLPDKKMETNIRQSVQPSKARPLSRVPSKNKLKGDRELENFKAHSARSVRRASKAFSEVEVEDPSLRLDVLNEPKVTVSVKELIEAFYSKFDEKKLDEGVHKFVSWAQKHSVIKLSDKLEKKYGEGLPAQTQLATRRKNLRSYLERFYMKHDRSKLDSEWTINKILGWTMANGIPKLNKKFHTRYGHVVVPDVALSPE